jgi:hypothetical protein
VIKGLALGLSAMLIAVAALHLYWGLGGFWPGHNNDSLVGIVVGPGPGGPVPPLWASLPAGALWACVFVFVARGLATYSWFFDNTQGTAFYELNRVLYFPLCLALGIGLGIVWFGRPRGGRSLDQTKAR